MTNKNPIKSWILIAIIFLFPLGYYIVNIIDFPKHQDVVSSKNEIPASAFFIESRPYNPLDGMISDNDKDWIDVDGLRNIAAGGASLINVENADWIGKEVVGIATVVDHTVTDESTSNLEDIQLLRQKHIAEILTSKYIDKLENENSFLPTSINTFPTQPKDDAYTTPEIIFGGSSLLIFTKPDGTGWQLNNGDRLTFRAEQYPLDIKRTDNNGQSIVFGYICDKTLYFQNEDNQLLHQYTLEAKENAEYYIILMNSDTIITLKEGNIFTIKKEME